MEMIPLENALEIVLNSAFGTGTETIDFTGSLNRILAVSISSDIDMPAFNKASVDGFACRKSEINHEMEIIETIPAGKIPEKTLGIDQCSRIMTGAVVPPGADCVIMVENSEIMPSGKVRFTGSFFKENIAFRGEDVKKGDVLLNPGRLIKPQDIAVMASAGQTSVVVSKKPAVAVISSGSELVEPSVLPGESQVRNINAYQIMAQVERSGAEVRYYGIAKDEEEETYRIIDKAISENDLVLITGGVSMGDFDFVPAVLERAGVKILFTRIAVQPGKPTTFGIHKKAIVFGLPGNPVSSYMMFEMLVRPLINEMMGYKWQPVITQHPLRNNYVRKFTERMALVPVKITNDCSVSPVEFHGSAHVAALPDADGIIIIPVGIKTIEKGKIVSVRQI
jgi:molybdopterin molybdotransferase